MIQNPAENGEVDVESLAEMLAEGELPPEEMLNELIGRREQDMLEKENRLDEIGQRLQLLAEETVRDRYGIETEWLENIRMYEGKYTDAQQAKFKARDRSQAFANLIRVKCDFAISRMCEMVAPTDDRNWDITHSPQPELIAAMRRDDVMEGPDGQPVSVEDHAAQVLQEAADKAAKMRRYMDDQLTECEYNAQIRKVLRDSIRLGTGVLKGPSVIGRTKSAWRRDTATGTSVYVEEEDLTPIGTWVDPWDFFPEFAAPSPEQAEVIFERHRCNRKYLRKLAKQPGFSAKRLNDVLDGHTRSYWLGQVSQVRGDTLNSPYKDGQYELWEYHGPLKAEEARLMGIEIDEGDNITEVMACVFFVEGKVVKASLNIQPDEAVTYYTYNWRKRDGCIFGYGMPQDGAHSQEAANSAWRLVLDNAAMSAIPQVVINSRLLKPVDKNYTMYPGKQWEMTEPNKTVQEAFGTFNVPANMQGLLEIFTFARELLDYETGISMLAQGQQGPSVTKTALGMSMLMNSASATLRQKVKEFDDEITAPFISNLYNWNMKFNPDEDAKGDYTIVPLGSSSLLVREQQTQGLMQMMQMAQMPMLAPWVKWDELFRAAVQSMSINGDRFVKTKAEFEQDQKNQAKNGPPPPTYAEQVAMGNLKLKEQQLQLDAQLKAKELQLQEIDAQIEQFKAQVDAQDSQNDLERQRQILRGDMMRLQNERDMMLMQMAEDRNSQAAQIQAELGFKQMDHQFDQQMFSAEALLKARTGSGI